MLLKLNLCLHHVQVRDLAAWFELLADIETARALSGGPVGNTVLPLRHSEVVISLHHCDDQATSGNLGAGATASAPAPMVRYTSQGSILVNIASADVFAHSVGA